MRLTDNKIEYDGCILYQVARFNTVTHCEELGGYIEKKLFQQIDSNSWIGTNSYVYRCSLLHGKFIIKDNSIVVDSMLSGKFFIKDHVKISGCNIKTRYYNCIIDAGAQVLNKTFVATGTYNAKLFDDEYFEYKCYGVVDLIMTKHYCKVFCLTMTYLEAWKYLHDDQIFAELQNKYQSTSPMQLFLPDTKQWLLEQCIIGLNKLRQG
jgi:hypothetical protein